MCLYQHRFEAAYDNAFSLKSYQLQFELQKLSSSDRFSTSSLGVQDTSANRPQMMPSEMGWSRLPAVLLASDFANAEHQFVN